MITLTDENFEKEITKSDKPVLVDFWALWCSPCFVLTPILEKLAEEYKDKFILAKVNLDYAPIAAQKYRIDRIPAVVLFKNGKPVSGFIGVKPEPVVKDIISQMLEDSEKKIGEIENIIKNYQEYAQKNGFKLNPDKGIVERLVKGLLENEKKYGAQYCPCRRITGNPEDDKGKICPCYWHQEELERDGHCFCGLFVK
ncbi:unnamed protein product [marine sediment metagenome]|uniref:Thioredoxin domain-containing protein n=1 Tax=marine sediment metagenome TaxID=412755 RepID=X1NYP7_9ZZZZ